MPEKRERKKRSVRYMPRKVPFADVAQPPAIRTWLGLATTVLLRDRDLLNSVNVFPVADADTGTNMAVTMRAAAQAGVAAPDNATSAEVLATASRWALSGARGNSGVILSEWLRGFAVAVGKRANLGHALHAAADAAWKAVVKPAPGSILTAMRAAADAALKAEADGHGSPLEAAVAAARAATADSPRELPVLATAGVVDAGACGFVLLLEALRVVLAGEANLAGSPNTDATPDPAAVQLGVDTHQDTDGAPIIPSEPHGSAEAVNTDEFEVIFNLSRPADALDYQAGTVVRLLREQLAALGDSVVVIGGSATDIDIPCKGDFTTRSLGTAAPAPKTGPAVDLADDDDIEQTTGIPSAWHAHVHVKQLKPVLQLVDRWRVQGLVTAEQIRYLAAPQSDTSVWAMTSDRKKVQALAEFGVTVQLIPQGEADAVADIARSLLSDISQNVLALVPAWVGVEAVQQQLAAQRAANATGGLDLTDHIELVEVADDNAVVDYLLDKMDAGAGG